jgi:hypothetical protein
MAQWGRHVLSHNKMRPVYHWDDIFGNTIKLYLATYSNEQNPGDELFHQTQDYACNKNKLPRHDNVSWMNL